MAVHSLGSDDSMSGLVAPHIMSATGWCLGFLWVEWFSSQFSVELNFHIICLLFECHCVWYCVVTAANSVCVICSLSSFAWCTVSQHSRYNTWLTLYIADNGIKQSLTKSDLWNIQQMSLMTCRSLLWGFFVSMLWAVCFMCLGLNPGWRPALGKQHGKYFSQSNILS